MFRLVENYPLNGKEKNPRGAKPLRFRIQKQSSLLESTLQTSMLEKCQMRKQWRNLKAWSKTPDRGDGVPPFIEGHTANRGFQFPAISMKIRE